MCLIIDIRTGTKKEWVTHVFVGKKEKDVNDDDDSVVSSIMYESTCKLDGIVKH